MFYDCHVHTRHSHDSSAAPDELCRAAITRNLSGITFTDHCDCEYAGDTDILQIFRNGFSDFASAKKTCSGKLALSFGIELGDPLFSPVFAQKICSAFDFDVILLSVHAVRMQGFDMPFSLIDFSEADDDFINAYLQQYFNDLLESVRSFDFDILCHLTVPLRYIILKYGKTVSLDRFYVVIREILQEVIRKDRTLEINTSAAAQPNGFLMPDPQIIGMYRSLGGKYLSVGSDAHIPERIGYYFEQTKEMLSSYNINSLCRYKKRQKRLYQTD